MYHLFTYELIDDNWEQVTCGYFQDRRDAEYAAISDYAEVSPMYLDAPSGEQTIIRK